MAAISGRSRRGRLSESPPPRAASRLRRARGLLWAYNTIGLMKLLKITVSLLVVLALCFGLGTLFLQGAISILDAGEVTYARKDQAPVTVSPSSHPFSYYYQLAFFGTSAGFVLLLGAAFCMYGIAKVIRMASSQRSQVAARIYIAATYVACSGISLFIVWLVLHLLRNALVA